MLFNFYIVLFITMTVKELIEKLKEVEEQDKEIVIGFYNLGNFNTLAIDNAFIYYEEDTDNVVMDIGDF